MSRTELLLRTGKAAARSGEGVTLLQASMQRECRHELTLGSRKDSYICISGVGSSTDVALNPSRARGCILRLIPIWVAKSALRPNPIPTHILQLVTSCLRELRKHVSPLQNQVETKKRLKL